jgi:hypothetical protein
MPARAAKALLKSWLDQLAAYCGMVASIAQARTTDFVFVRA